MTAKILVKNPLAFAFFVLFPFASQSQNFAKIDHLPQAVSTKKAPCYMRVGPGKHFPIDWVYNYPNTPFKVLAEFQGWYKVKDFQGTTGWISRTLLTRSPSKIVLQEAALYQTDRMTSRIQATLKPNVIVAIKSCAKTMCHVQLKHEGLKFTGYVPNTALWP